MVKSLLDFCTTYKEDCQSLFILFNIKCCKTKDFVDFIFNEFKQTRLDFGSIETIFKTFADIKKVKHEIIPVCWNIIKDFLGDFPVDPIEYDNLRKELSKKHLDSVQIDNIIEATKLLHDKSGQTLNANVRSIQQSTERKIGFIGELFSFLFSRDVQKTNCLFHKLVLDNPNSTRPGLDLLAIKFNEPPKDDEVHFWESKSTLSNVNNQQYKIIQWFNAEKNKKYISNVIEAARLSWKESLSNNEFERANIALAKFQANSENFKFIGSIVFESTINIRKKSFYRFCRINVAKEKKLLVLFNIEKLEELINDVYDKTCI